MRTHKTITIILTSLLILGALILGVILIGTFALWWNGAFNKLDVKNIASYEKNGYTLFFQQLGDPQWPFGSTDVRLLLKNQQGKVINKYDTSIQDDGANAGERNIASVEWFEDRVIVILCASEMKDREITFSFKSE